MIEIPLSSGRVAFVDDEDADLARLVWTDSPSSHVSYAGRKERIEGRRVYVTLHRIIGKRMGLSGIIDHRDRNGLNCTRANLRSATPSQNSANCKLASNNTTGYKGVARLRRGKWSARIKVNRHLRWLGSFADPMEAARAYDRAALEYFGEFARLNFPVPTATVPPIGRTER